MKTKMKVLASLFLSSSVAQASELDALIASSAAIVDQINTGILMTGAAMGYAHTGTGLSDGQLAGTGYITTEQDNAMDPLGLDINFPFVNKSFFLFQMLIDVCFRFHGALKP